MIFDTDIFIWMQKGHPKAVKLIKKTPERFLSVQTYMELLQGARNKKQHTTIKNFLNDYNFLTLSLTDNIGHRALIYIEEFSLSHGLRSADALIAATAVENHLPLASGNTKHFRVIKDLQLKIFTP